MAEWGFCKAQVEGSNPSGGSLAGGPLGVMEARDPPKVEEEVRFL
jgi:hypothetical protein